MKSHNEGAGSLHSSSQYYLGTTGSQCILLPKETCAAISKVTGEGKIKKYGIIGVHAGKLPHSSSHSVSCKDAQTFWVSVL